MNTLGTEEVQRRLQRKLENVSDIFIGREDKNHDKKKFATLTYNF